MLNKLPRTSRGKPPPPGGVFGGGPRNGGVADKSLRFMLLKGRLTFENMTIAMDPVLGGAATAGSRRSQSSQIRRLRQTFRRRPNARGLGI